HGCGDRRGARRAPGAAHPRRRHRLRLPGRSPGRARSRGRDDRANPRACRAGAGEPRRHRLRRGGGGRRRRDARLGRARAVRRDRGRGRRAGGPRDALRAAAPGRADGRPGWRAPGPAVGGDRPQPGGAGRDPLRPVSVRPARRRGGLRRMTRVHVLVRGRVQGVFYRAEARDRAESLRVAGWIRNLPDGSVEAVFEGEDDRVESMVAWCRRGPAGAGVEAVGATGYLINLAVYTVLLKEAGFHYALAATCSFVVAVTNNYIWNRLWTFHDQRGHVGWQGLRFLIVALVAYATNLALLVGFVALG